MGDNWEHRNIMIKLIHIFVFMPTACSDGNSMSHLFFFKYNNKCPIQFTHTLTNLIWGLEFNI